MKKMWLPGTQGATGVSGCLPTRALLAGLGLPGIAGRPWRHGGGTWKVAEEGFCSPTAPG